MISFANYPAGPGPFVGPVRGGGEAATLPVNTVAPGVTGTAFPQGTLTCTTGTWTGSPTPTFTYQWYRDGILQIGKQASTVVLSLTDIGSAWYCRVRATNSVGGVNANSNTVTVWHPDDIAGVARFWWAQANVLNSVSPDVAATTGQAVRRWNGIISGTQADQTTGANQPIWRATGQSGGPSLEFDSTDRFDLPANSDVLQNKEHGYLIVGCRDTGYNAGAGTHVIMRYTVNGGTNDRLSVFTRAGGTNNFSANARRGDSDPGRSVATPSNADYNVLVAHADWQNNLLRLRVNGSQIGTVALIGSGNSANTTSDTGSINLANNAMIGHLTAACVVNASITATELSQLERFIGLMGALNIPLV